MGILVGYDIEIPRWVLVLVLGNEMASWERGKGLVELEDCSEEKEEESEPDIVKHKTELGVNSNDDNCILVFA